MNIRNTENTEDIHHLPFHLFHLLVHLLMKVSKHVWLTVLMVSKAWPGNRNTEI
jgi:hypothetical protein